VIAFSDGVIAIALTLLILPLTDLRPEGADVLTLVSDHRGALVGFALTFAVIARYWTAHHTMLRFLSGHTPRLISLNTFWLATIVFLPFPTSLIEDDLQGGYATLYLLSLVLTSAATLALARYLQRHPELRADDADDLGPFVLNSLAAVGALVAALLISLVNPVLGMFAIFLLVPAPHVARFVQRRVAHR
jgi:uncharacterized membrane protein